MTHYLVTKSNLKGEITTPPSKSQTLRAILFGALGKGKSIIYGYLDSPDTKKMIDACRLFGASVHVFPEKIEISGLNGKIKTSEDVINAGNSGIVLRFCSAVAALSDKPIVITGDHSIRHLRLMQPLLDGLKQLGCKAISTKDDGFAPVIIQGRVTKNIVTISGEDSQAVSALLILLSFTKGPSEIFVNNPGEKPWVHMTLNWLEKLKISCKNHNFHRYEIDGSGNFEGFEYHVPGDISSASFPIVAALVTNSELTIKNVDTNDCQGDKELIKVLRLMGADIEIDHEKKTIRVKKDATLTGITVDINNFIDAVPILSVIACFAKGNTTIFNASPARGKECNRLAAISTELKKMGAQVQETEDGLIIHESSLHGAKVNSYNDHRMCMSLAVAGLGASSGVTEIEGIECVSKTFPTFLKDFQAIQANIKFKD
jgi:3-phosphoshikimate 1-carboxyvinyltransferase